MAECVYTVHSATIGDVPVTVQSKGKDVAAKVAMLIVEMISDDGLVHTHHFDATEENQALFVKDAVVVASFAKPKTK